MYNVPERVPMEIGDICSWYLLKLPDNNFAVQYTGTDPANIFPTSMSCSFPRTGNADMAVENLLDVVEEFHNLARIQEPVFPKNVFDLPRRHHLNWSEYNSSAFPIQVPQRPPSSRSTNSILSEVAFEPDSEDTSRPPVYESSD